MANEKVKITGYSKKESIDGKIEWSQFNPNLVGLQLTSDGGSTLFTMGNFSITTNTKPQNRKTFITNSLSNFITLTSLDTTLDDAKKVLLNNSGVILNLNKKKTETYALFTSYREFIRVALENIIINFPAALFVAPLYALSPEYVSVSGFTNQDYVYNNLDGTATFKINVNNIQNKYNINFLSNANINPTTNQLRDLTTSYLDYVVYLNDNEYNVINFTGSTSQRNDFIYFKVKGNPFTGNTNDYYTFYIKPNKIKENNFFNSLPNFEYYILNRLTIPKYTSVFDMTIKTDTNGIVKTTQTLSWPTSDGYNIDFDTIEYETYANELLEMSLNSDLTTSNLMVRFLVTESITDFDTTAVHLSSLDQDTSEQKVNKTLVIYGRNFDEINSYITGIKYANTVSYDKQNNTPDIYLKDIAKVMGWELISSILENNLLKNYITPQASNYSGQSIGLTLVEADIELWRRIILNTPWIWKSKGTRKSIEFLFKFIGAPTGLINFNEYVYVAENKIDYDLFFDIVDANNLNPNENLYSIDSDGYPRPRITNDLYFQSKGQWYRETGGYNSTIEINDGNNPHVGEYDNGNTYIKQFIDLIPNFSAVTISSETVTTKTDNIFLNYNGGTITQYTGQTYVDLTTIDNISFDDCYVVNAEVVPDPKQRQDKTNCGCDIPENLKSLSICLNKKTYTPEDCESEINTFEALGYGLYYTYYYYQYAYPSGEIYTISGSPQYNESIFVNPDCCTKLTGGDPVYYNDSVYDSTSNNFLVQNSGYICCTKSSGSDKDGDCGCFVTCNWRINQNQRTIEYPVGSGNFYLNFIDEQNNNKILSYNGCNCVRDYTTPIQITISGQTGFGCQLTQIGNIDILNQNSIIVDTYNLRATNIIGCNESALDNITQPRIFGVILNDQNQIGGIVNSITFDTLQNQQIGGILINGGSQLSANTNGVGYMVEYIGQQIPNFGDTVRMRVYSGTTSNNNSNLAFDFNLNKMKYLISTNVFDSSTFGSQIQNLQPTQNLQSIPVTNNVGYYTSEYTFNSSGINTNVYMVFDYRQNQINPTNASCHLFYNQTRTNKLIYWEDINGVYTQEILPRDTSVLHCAVNGTAGGDNVIIIDQNTPCNADIQCDALTQLITFIAQNSTTSGFINDVRIFNTNQQLPINNFQGYPVSYGNTITGVRDVIDINSRIAIRVNNNIKFLARLYKINSSGETLLQEIQINPATYSNTLNIEIIFSAYLFGANDIIKIQIINQ